MKNFLLTYSLVFTSIVWAQNQYTESENPNNMATGVYYQKGPGGNNSTFNWTYPYGMKLTVLESQFRNFELITTSYPFGDLKLRQWNPTNSTWSNWRNILTENEAGNVGIGTTSPTKRLDVNGTLGAQGLLVVQTGGSYKVAINGQTNGYITGRNSSFENKFYIASNGTSYLNGGNVGIGTTSPGSWKLAVNGNIRAKEIKVETGWSDFVFDKNYYLPTLEEVEAHIKDFGHLKDIPSAKEVEENGIFLGEMDSKLLQKIEELTLYIIQQQKEIESLKSEIAKLKN